MNYLGITVVLTPNGADITISGSPNDQTIHVDNDGVELAFDHDYNLIDARGAGAEG